MSSKLILLFLCSVVVGCSAGSTNNEPDSGGSLTPADAQESQNDTTLTDVTTGVPGDLSNDQFADNPSDLSDSQIHTEPDTNTTEPTDAIDPDTAIEPTPTGQDPLIQTTTEVTFNMTVPAYQSNELRIALVWGDMNLTASWVGDEYWTATTDLPTGKQDTLKVTFYDRNGDIELAVAEQDYTTGFNAAESVDVPVDQFDRERFDDDADGISNLDELIAGNDPLVDEISLLEIRDSVEITYLIHLSQLLESKLPVDRPYTLSDFVFIPVSDEEDALGTSYTTNIDIDASGNGTYAYSTYAHWFRESRNGTRTNNGTAISWEGSLSTYDGDYGRSTKFTTTVSKLDDGTHEFVEELSEVYSGTYRDTWNVTSKLTGVPIEGTSLCKAIAGTVTYVRGTNRNGSFSSFDKPITTVTKAAEDQFWKVVYVNAKDETTEFLARELVQVGNSFLTNDRSPEKGPASFICDFADSSE